MEVRVKGLAVLSRVLPLRRVCLHRGLPYMVVVRLVCLLNPPKKGFPPSKKQTHPELGAKVTRVSEKPGAAVWVLASALVDVNLLFGLQPKGPAQSLGLMHPRL